MKLRLLALRLALSREFWFSALVVLCEAGFYFSRYPGRATPVMGALSFIPIALLALFSIRQTARRRPLWLAGLAISALAAWRGPRGQDELMWLNFVEYIAINLLLAIEFGRTLTAGREPLCTQFARLVSPEMSVATVRYTRSVTLAWTVFFVVMMGLSTVLFVTLTPNRWALFADVLTPIVVLAMFLIEYRVRYRVLPARERLDFGSAFRGYRAAMSRGDPPARAVTIRPEAP
jgi:uncharacterized membrane protein